MPAGWWPCPGSWTCTRTCGSPAGRTPRRSRPARRPRPSAATRRGSPWATPIRWRTTRGGASTWGGAGLAAPRGAGRRAGQVPPAGAAEILRGARDRGAGVPAEVPPPHLLLDDERLSTYAPVNKVTPPLRTVADAKALRAALAEGVLDCVA